MIISIISYSNPQRLDSNEDSGGETYEDQEPYRLFGLKLQKCGFENVRLGLAEKHLLEKLDELPGQSLEEIVSKMSNRLYIAAMKLTLQKFTECLVTNRLSEGFIDFFKQLKPSDFQERLQKGECYSEFFYQVHKTHGFYF